MKLPKFRDPSEQATPNPEDDPDNEPERPVGRPLAPRRSLPADPAGPAADASTNRPAAPARPRPTSGQGSGRRPPGSVGKGINPGLKLRAFEAAARAAPPPQLPWYYRLRPDPKLTRQAAWNVAAVSSLIVNTLLVSALLLMAVQIRNLKKTLNLLLSGLYSNFVAMDNASIDTTITVNTDVQLNFLLPIQQNTDVVLTQNVPIPGARVTINSDLLTINNAPANVTLPAGTSLPIALNMSVPVLMTVPVSLQVPVSIPLAETQLHAPFRGLQDTVGVIYCTFNKNAQYPEGVFICQAYESPTPVPGAP